MQGELYPYLHFGELWLYVNSVQIYDLGMFFSKKLKSNDFGIFNGFYKWNQLGMRNCQKLTFCPNCQKEKIKAHQAMLILTLFKLSHFEFNAVFSCAKFA
jgi:hypothetical protein